MVIWVEGECGVVTLKEDNCSQTYTYLLTLQRDVYDNKGLRDVIIEKVGIIEFDCWPE